MSEREFTVTDTTTWPMALTAEQTAAIYQRTLGALRKAVQLGRFVPAPYEKKPLRWRRVDIERHLVGARGFSSIKRVS